MNKAIGATARRPSLDLVAAALDFIYSYTPKWWVLENVHGAHQFIVPILGKPRQRIGPFLLWGNFPPITATVEHMYKSKKNGARNRGHVPYSISSGLADAVEAQL